MTMPIKAVIFDCDGTLVDSEPLLLAALLAEVEALPQGRPVHATLADIEGRSMALNLELMAQRSGLRLPADFEVTVRRRLSAMFHAALQPIPGALATLQGLRLPRCVASNGPLDKIELALSITGLRERAGRHLFSAYEVGSFKPEPGLFIHAAQVLGVKPHECAVVEDSLAGIHAGLAAGMAVYAYRPAGSMPPDIAGRVQRLERLTDLCAEPWNADRR
jgi:HAD superfamily hydrolase (TIGR01509 family)